MLTTRCPHCHTAFRIRPEQLSVRGGRVRCGHCQQAFSALEQLEDVDEEDLTPAPPVPPRPAVGSRPGNAPSRPQNAQPVTKPAAPKPSAPPPAVKPVAPSAPQPVSDPAISPALFTASGLPPLRQSQSAPATAPARPKNSSPAKFPEVAGSTHPSASPRKVSPGQMSSMPVPNAIEHDEVSPITSWDDFQIPVDMEEMDDDSAHSSSGTKSSSIKETKESSPAKKHPDIKTHKEPTLGSVPSGDDEEFSMSIVLDGDSVPVNTPHDPDFDKTPAQSGQQEPYQSEIAKQLGIPPYAQEGSHAFDQTVMLEEPVEIGHTQMDNGPDSLFEEHERQQRQKDGHGRGVEDRRHKKSGGYVWLLGALGMLVVFVILAAYLLRMELARAVPTLRPTLETACSWVGCTVPFPKDADQIVVEGHSFTPEDGQDDGHYRLVVTLLNKAPYEQAWPHLELTVTDRFDIAVARRVLKPEEWLPQANRSQRSFSAKTEITANLPITLNNVQASGYRLYVFYP